MVTPYIGAYLKIAKYTTPGRSIRYSQGLRRIPRSRPRRRRRGVAAVLTSSSSASGAGAAGVLVEVIDPSLSGAGARRLPHPDPCDRSVRFLGQLVHLVDDLLAAAGEIGRAHVCTPVTLPSRMPSSA